jgi:hypothetical protein
VRLIAFITEGTQIRKILDHIGVDVEPPRITPARGPPLWDGCDAPMGEGAQIKPLSAPETTVRSPQDRDGKKFP